MFKKVLASATMVALLTGMLGTTAFAQEVNEITTDGTTVEGIGEVVSPTIAVVLPGDLSFGLNPLRLDSDGDTTTTGDDGQIVATDFLISNYSDVPVLVDTATTLTPASGITLVTAPTFNANTKELSNGAKNVWIVQQLPSATVVDTTNPDGKLTVTELTAGSATITTVGKTLGSAAVNTAFKLNTYSEAAGLKPENVSGFKLTGAVDPSTTFAEGDVTIKTVFKITALTPNQYTSGYTADSNWPAVVTETPES